MTLNLKIASRDDIEVWDSLVERSPHGSLFHTWRFLEIVEKYTNSKLIPVIGLRGTTPIGIYPLFLQKKHSVKLVLSPPPKTLLLYMGPVLADFDKMKQSKKESIFLKFQKEINKFLQSELHYNYVRIRTPPELIDSRPFLWTGYKVEPLYTYTIELYKNSETVWRNFNKQLRVDIGKTEREGVKVKEGTKKDLEFLRESVADRFIEQGYKTRDYRRYLDDIYNAFHPENFRVFVGEYKGETVGGLTLFCFKNRASLWMGIPKTDLKGIYPNDLVVWESIKWACKNGYKEYEIMDAGDDPRLRHFKSKFNPKPDIWYSAVKYSSFFYIALERVRRFIR